ncbi:Alpha/Beta hydrolase protein [Phlyctochytrium arcticum]|nr:Alpha/Beta hydrolase protein [Phlyctochytrium arcticum]
MTVQSVLISLVVAGLGCAQLILLAGVYIAHRPPTKYRKEALKFLVMGIGMMFTEALGAIILVDIVYASIVGAVGGFDTIGGQIVLALTAASVLGCTVVGVRMGIDARRAVLNAVARDGIRISSDPPSQFWTLLPGIFLYWQTFNVRHHRNITYATDEELEKAGYASKRLLQLDVIHHKSAPKGCPVLVYMHGGAWQFGDKGMVTMPVCWHMASTGKWIVVNINYRMSPQVHYPEHLIDIKRALRWVRQNIHEYGGDPNFIAVCGGSAGGHLASMAALTPNEPSFQPGFESVDTRVNASVTFYPVVEVTKNSGYAQASFHNWFARAICGLSGYEQEQEWLKKRACPLALVQSVDPKVIPPTMVLHGANDCIVPVGTSRHYVDVLRKAEVPKVHYVEFAAGQHAFDVTLGQQTRWALWAISGFLDRVYADWASHTDS